MRNQPSNTKIGATDSVWLREMIADTVKNDIVVSFNCIKPSYLITYSHVQKLQDISKIKKHHKDRNN